MLELLASHRADMLPPPCLASQYTEPARALACVLAHAWRAPLGHALALLGCSAPPARHSVLYVGFDDPAPSPLDNSQAATPDTALSQLGDGSSWAAMLRCTAQARTAIDWIMRVRHHPGSSRAVLLSLADDPAGPVALQALRAGADVVLAATVEPPLLQAQLARLRERVAPPPAGRLFPAPGCALHAATRQLQLPAATLALAPQMFRLLWTLCERPGRVLDAASLRVALDIPARADAQSLHTAVGKLRRVLREHGLDGPLQTVHGSGYRWSPPANALPGTELEGNI